MRFCIHVYCLDILEVCINWNISGKLAVMSNLNCQHVRCIDQCAWPSASCPLLFRIKQIWGVVLDVDRNGLTSIFICTTFGVIGFSTLFFTAKKEDWKCCEFYAHSNVVWKGKSNCEAWSSISWVLIDLTISSAGFQVPWYGDTCNAHFETQLKRRNI